MTPLLFGQENDPHWRWKDRQGFAWETFPLISDGNATSPPVFTRTQASVFSTPGNYKTISLIDKFLYSVKVVGATVLTSLSKRPRKRAFRIMTLWAPPWGPESRGAGSSVHVISSVSGAKHRARGTQQAFIRLLRNKHMLNIIFF